jgi:hypothetical protein
MAADGRNQALVGMADGIPMFRDKQSRGVTPIALRTASLPDHLSVKFRNIHLSALYPHDFWRLSEEGSKWERAPRKPKSLSPLLHVLVDDLLFWEDGQTTEDHSKHLDDPDRFFTLRAILLFWCGDYPGLGETTSFAHSGTNACHWCWVEGIWGHGVNREAYGEYIRCSLAHMLASCDISILSDVHIMYTFLSFMCTYHTLCILIYRGCIHITKHAFIMYT